jgi:hypothetical protein
MTVFGQPRRATSMAISRYSASGPRIGQGRNVDEAGRLLRPPRRARSRQARSSASGSASFVRRRQMFDHERSDEFLDRLGLATQLRDGRPLLTLIFVVAAPAPLTTPWSRGQHPQKHG